MDDVLQKPIAVLGAGSWGTALALLLARNGNPVRLWDIDTKHALQLQKKRVSEQYLPGYPFPNNLAIFTELAKCLQNTQDVLIVVPSFGFRPLLETMKPLVVKAVRIAWGSKGLDPDSKKLLHRVVFDVFSKDTPVAALAGPSFAKEVAEQMPTAVSLAGNNAEFIQDLITRCHNDRFRVYENPDLIGVQLCSVLKNVLAIAVGIADGLEFGANTRAALITRGLVEMGRLSEAMGGQKKTLLSLAGLGDLVLTATDDQSRNRRFGIAVGRGMDVKSAEKEIGEAVEGLKNVRQVFELSQELKVDMPIATQVYGVLCRGYSPEDVLGELLLREPKVEY